MSSVFIAVCRNGRVVLQVSYSEKHLKFVPNVTGFLNLIHKSLYKEHFLLIFLTTSTNNWITVLTEICMYPIPLVSLLKGRRLAKYTTVRCLLTYVTGRQSVVL